MAIMISAAIVILLAIVVIYYYNRLVQLKNLCDSSWSDINVQLKRRWDLIPNLVETVKGYAAHESKTLENVTTARNMAMSAKSVTEHAEAENMLTGTLKSLFAVSEAYPELRANTNFLDLQNSLSTLENDIQLARRYYNAVVRDMNTLCETFPSVIIANMFGFAKRPYFEIDSAETANVKVSF